MKPGIHQALLRQNENWLLFTHPQEILQTQQLTEVLPALRYLETQVEKNGLHAVGFLSYEAAPAFDPALQALPAPGFPLLWFGLYPPPASVSLPALPPNLLNLRWKPDTSRRAYQNAIREVKKQIASGNTYQVNYTLVTPPVGCGLLAGTFRAWLLQSGQIKEQVLRVEDLPQCKTLYRINSIRRWQKVSLSPPPGEGEPLEPKSRPYLPAPPRGREER